MAKADGNPWTVLGSTPIYENPWIRVIEHDVLNPRGKPGIYGVVGVKSIATGVVPIHEDGSVTLVGQYRFPLGHYSWEIPEGGGRMDEDPLVAIQRELVEETGLSARNWRHIQTMHLSNSITDEVAHLYLAWGLEQGQAMPEDTEELAIRRVPFAEAFEMAMRGDMTDAMTVAALLKTRHLAREAALPADVAHLIL